jgi:hypothetical protein
MGTRSAARAAIKLLYYIEDGSYMINSVDNR